MNFKVSSGFTLVEVLIATAVMGIMFVSIFALQASVTRSVSSITRRFERILHARNFFIESAESSAYSEKDVVTMNDKIDRPAADLQYKKSKVTSDEPFGKFAHNLYKQQVTIVWQDGNKKKQQERLVGYIYQPKKSADEKEKSPVSPSPTGKPPVSPPTGAGT